MSFETDSATKPTPPLSAVRSDALVLPLRGWIVEIPTRVVHTMIVSATSRKDAEMKLRNRAEHLDDFSSCGSNIESAGIGRVICEDGKKSQMNNLETAEGAA